jgi:xylulokinase
MVLLDEAGEVVRPALLWNDNRSAGAATDLLDELGGPEEWARAVGSVPGASFTVSKLRWVAEHEPQAADRADAVLLPHDWLTLRLAAQGGGVQEPTTDRGDASGTGYWSSADGAYRDDLLRLAFGRDLRLPRVADPAKQVAEGPGGLLLGPGTGDNMAAALALGLGPGDVVVSVGTSGTVFAVSDTPTADPDGAVAGFADAAGRFLPLVCTLNAARVLSTVAGMLGVDLAAFDDMALSVPDSGGLILLPFLDGERTPPLPLAAGLLHGITRHNATPAHVARAAVEGMLCGLADGLDRLRAQGIRVRRVLVIGGGARSRAVQTLSAALLGAPVSFPEPAEYVAIGAALQAAWALSDTKAPPQWPVAQASPTGDDARTEKRPATREKAVRDAYADTLESARALLSART